MADSKNPNGTNSVASTLLPNFYKTDANKKFLQATIEQLVQPGTVQKVNGYIGRKNAKAAKSNDVYVEAADSVRQNYQLEPGFVIQDTLGNTTFFKDYIDYINQLSVFGGDVSKHPRINSQEFYSWDPHINWDMFVNFQNYYWLPYGPDTITIAGQQLAINSTYTVELKTEAADYQYVFTPDGATPNPTLKLYRGQTYTFEINSPGHPFSFKLSRSQGSTDRYNTPNISAYGVKQGTIVFSVPKDAPNIIYYQSEADQNVGGVIQIDDITENTFIDVEADVLGKKSYTLPNGITLSNGMKVAFSGNVAPATYANAEFYVEGVGSSIQLVNKNILEIITTYTRSESVYFDSTPFDAEPFSDSTGFALTKDYLTINRASRDHNPWSRYNRWFHKDVITTAANLRGQTVNLDQTARAVRPIIEFNADLKLFNFGTYAVNDVDIIDTFTTDVFSTIEGSVGYNVDGIQLTENQLVLFTADTDRLVKNNIYKVTFVNIQGYRQIHLEQYSAPATNQVVLVHRGDKNQGQMFWYNGESWILGQQKTQVNQAPLFDIVNSDKVSFGNTSVYPGSTFKGTSLFTYKAGTGTTDAALGFALSYKNINNIGDIVFNFTLVTDTFQYKLETTTALSEVEVKTGYLVSQDYAGNPVYQNGWQTCTAPNTQAAVRIYKNSNLTNNFPIDIFDNIYNLNDLIVRVYINGVRLDPSLWSIIDAPVYKEVVLATPLSADDILTIKAFSLQAINSNGYYEIPVNLQNNPLNNDIGDFTLGEVIDHVNSIIEHIPASLLDSDDDSDLHSPEVTIGNQTYDPDLINIRDLGNITQYGTKFVQHSGPASLAVYHITSEQNNIVRAIEKNREDYNNFKRNFVYVAETLGVDAAPEIQVDLILNKINKDKAKNSPYYFSDMVPYGSSRKTDLTVVDPRIKTYPLTNVFSLDSLSNQAVGVYLNGTQLLQGKQYTFNSQGFVVIDDSVVLFEDSTITIYEYDNTDGCFVPETPTKLGIWPKYEPKIYLDTTLVTPVNMIQGHDGALTAAYNDYRDSIILELEKRIYNNIKVKYDEAIYDIADVIPSYNRTNEYSLTEFNQVLAQNFYKWASLIDTDFSKPLKFDLANSFTYNYVGHSLPDGRSAPGYWRGVYRWLLDTDRPNICPWEMLGFSEEPTWWTKEYGPAPYTSNNLPMWQDIANGLVRGDGSVPAQTRSKFVKPFLMNHIPVDENGNLISPMIASLVQGSITQDTGESYVFGDVGPVESAWRKSSHYPFSILLTSMLLSPAKTFGLLLDRSRIVRNLAGQLIYNVNGLRIRPADIVLPSIVSSTTRVQTAGIINYLVNYILSDNLKSYNSYQYDLDFISTKLSYRIGAFTSKEKFNMLLDSKTYANAGSVFVPQEDYGIILNSSSPIKKITYSGVIISRLTDGYEVKGYSQTQPYFKYYQWTQSGVTINIGGISETYTIWQSEKQYGAGTVVKYGNSYYRVMSTHTTTKTFVPTYYQLLGQLPVIGGREAVIRKLWNRTNAIVVPYGTKFTTIQGVVDFLLGYGEWLKDEGFIFDDFNNTLQAVTNWETSAKEFLFWTTQNWSSGEDKWEEWNPTVPVAFNSIIRHSGSYYRASRNIPATSIFNSEDYVKLDGLSNIGSSVISLSPSADRVMFNTTLSVVDNITNPFNGYEIFKVDGTPLNANFINSFRQDNAVTYSPRTNDGIYGASFYLVQKEQVVILNNSTMFNDTIYNPETGYRQERIKVAGYLSINWYGGFDVPGFVFDEALVEEWTPWTDYHLGDIVKHKEFYYSANAFAQGSETFVSSSWVKLKEKPTPQLLPNWTYKASQFEDFYSLDSDNFDAGQQKMAQHLIGYQKRQYLENIIKDDVSEFKFFQGMVREKGTQNVLNKLFDVLSANNKESLAFHEEWAIRLGQYGASGAFDSIEFVLDEGLFKINPQGFSLVDQADPNAYDYIIRQTSNSVYLKPLGYNNKPWPLLENYQQYLRSAGYVKASDVFVSVGYLSDIVNYDVTTFENGAYIWCAFEGTSWNVYRFSDVNFKVTNVSYSGTTLTITLENLVPITAGMWIGISQTTGINGFYQVTSVRLNEFTVTATLPNWVDPFADQDSIIIYALLSQRASSIDEIDTIVPRRLAAGELLWTDDRGDGTWATWEYNPVYTNNRITNTNPESQLNYGRNVTINQNGNFMGISTSNGEFIVWDKASRATPWIQRQAIQQPYVTNSLQSSSLYATTAAFSPDGTWLATGSPYVGYAHTRYQGEYTPATTYFQGDIVSNNLEALANNGQVYFYRALQLVPINTLPASGRASTAYWESIPYIPVELHGTSSGLAAQGAIHLYKKDADNIFVLVDTIVSPQPAASELFGSNIKFMSSADPYKLLVGAPGSDTVYEFNYGTIVEATSAYNPTGSFGGTLVLTSTVGILPGMTVSGTGFTSGQTVLTVVDSTTLELDGSPNSRPSGLISFTITNWFSSAYQTGEYWGLPSGSNYGINIVVSGDGKSAYAVSALNGTDNGSVVVVTETGTGNSVFTGVTTEYGRSVAISNDGTYIAIGDPLHTDVDVHQGLVLVSELVDGTYTGYQILKNHQSQSSGFFGSKLAFMTDDTLVVFSSNGNNILTMTFDGTQTTFDKDSTAFVTTDLESGRVDIYDRYATKWVFSETLETTNVTSDGFGVGFAVGQDHIIIGAPLALDRGLSSGLVFDYAKPFGNYTWTVTHYEVAKPDVSKVKRAFLYNRVTGDLVTHLDVVDPLQGKIAGIAAEEITFSAYYDPAVYSVGTDAVNVNVNKPWTKAQVGKLWWDLRSAKFVNPFDNDIVYRNSNWNTLAAGASIDIYEWVSTTYLPAAWDAIADTETGLASGISGTSLYGNSAYSVSQVYDTVSQSFRNTYYYWVKNKKVVPDQQGRYISAAEVSSLISNPRGQGHQYLSLTGLDSFSLVNVKPDLQGTNIVLAVEYWNIAQTDRNVHSHWKIITNDVDTTIPATIEQKWIDSLCGRDINDRPVPDLNQPIKLRYGIENRPRQSMFVNRFEVLKQVVEQANIVLANNQIVSSKNITALEKYHVYPDFVTLDNGTKILPSGAYDAVADTDVELAYISIGAFRRPVLAPQITDGRITGITITYPGAGYIYPPYIEISGNGTGAVVRAVINATGQITGATIENSGEGYNDNTVAIVRDYSALVYSDSQNQGAWSIYSYDPVGKVWSRVKSKTYDTRNYWNYVDWYATGYNQFSAADYAVDTLSELNSISPELNQLVLVRNTGTGGWQLLEKYASSASIDWTQSYHVVGIQNGTIQLSSNLYSFANTSVGYDDSTFDGTTFDSVATEELRIILTALKNDLFTDELKQEYINLFFISVRYALSEQTYLDWIFKTSFVKANHNVGELSQPVNYQTDNLSNFQDYVAEVKPYRTKIREYISTHSKLDTAETLVTDFDLPSIYDNGKLTTINTRVRNGKVQANNSAILTYPWKNWYDNVGFTVTELRLVDGGSGYFTEPTVVITSDSGSGSTARAFFSNGKVNRIILLTPGSGYLSAPTVTINGGYSDTGTAATAVAIIGDGVVRSSLIKMKFDRLTQTYFITQLEQTETFVGTGSRLQFSLAWAPDVRVGYSSVTVNGIEVLRDLYTLKTVTSTDLGYTSYSGSITFTTAPALAAEIKITYLKNWDLLNAADRTQYYYNPQSGQLGNDLSQLMTGIDYGGVVVGGLGYEISSGWGALPYYSDKWDTFDATYTDYTVTVSPNTHSFELPYLPTAGTKLNVYYTEKSVDEFPSDGSTLFYVFNFQALYPAVSVITTQQTTGIANTAGVNVLHLTDVTGIAVNDIVTFTGNTVRLVPTSAIVFGYKTKVIAVDTVGNTVTLDQILFDDIASGTDITFYRDLVQPTDVTIYANGTILLTNPISSASVIYVTGQIAPIRIDDDAYDTPVTGEWTSSTYYAIGEVVTTVQGAVYVALVAHTSTVLETEVSAGKWREFNYNAIMQTVIADGVTSTFSIPGSFTVSDGDQFTWRQSTSDGSVKPQEQDYDTALSGGDLAYSTATGLSAEEIIVDGDGFVTPTSSPAPEEVVPGQVVDTVAIKVYDQPAAGSGQIKIDNYVADGKLKKFKITQTPNNPRAVIVKLDDTIVTYSSDYTIDYKNSTIKFPTAPTANTIVSIFSIGFNGSGILDLDYFIGDGTTQEFVTKSPWIDSVTSLVYVDGLTTNPALFKTDSTYISANRVGLKFASAPPAGSLINYIIVSGNQQTFSITKTERLLTNGNTTYTLEYPVGDSLPLESNIIVRANQNILSGPNNSYFTIANNQFKYTIDPTSFLPYSVPIDDINVLADGILLELGQDYTIDLSGISVTIDQTAYETYVGKKLIISISSDQEYTYDAVSGTITFKQTFSSSDVVEVISSYKHDILDIERTDINVSSSLVLTPDTVTYFYYKSVTGGILKLNRPVLNDSYVWVVKNKKLLTPAIDYKLNDDHITVTLSADIAVDDQITLVAFSNSVLTSGIAYMQFKDMLNRVHFKRLNLHKETYLVEPLHYNDTTITVADTSKFDIPNPAQNKPGIIEIRGERIEFFAIDGNVLSQLRRGTLGTGTPTIHNAGSWVQEIGASETIPYFESTVTNQLVSTGSNLVDTTFVPTMATDSVVVWFAEYGYKFKDLHNSAAAYDVKDAVIFGGQYFHCIKAVPAVADRLTGVNYLPNGYVYWTTVNTQIPVGYSQSNDIEVFIGGHDTSTVWSPNTEYTAGTIVIVGSYTYKANIDHTSSTAFTNDSDVWTFFIGNIRLKKKPYKVHNVSLASTSPAGDVQLDADFAVDGVNPQIRLTNPPPVGTYITVVKRQGTDWDSTVSILEDNSNIALFLKTAPGIWYKEFKQSST
jgi:hypothetical protein